MFFVFQRAVIECNFGDKWRVFGARKEISMAFIVELKHRSKFKMNFNWRSVTRQRVLEYHYSEEFDVINWQLEFNLFVTPNL
jgi:hypothetical protein